jgi:hypothetical protein
MSGRASCKKRTSNISIFIAPMCIFLKNFIVSIGGLPRKKQKKRTVPRMVDTNSCQSLMMFRYVMEFEDLVNASPRRVSPGARVRVSNRRMEPLREPVYTKHWSASPVGRDVLFTILDGLPPPDALRRHRYVSLSAKHLTSSLYLA